LSPYRDNKENPMMPHSLSWCNILRNYAFYLQLQEIDRDLAGEVRAKGCPHCGSRLHFARYARKPRGAPGNLPEDFDRRESLCCSAKGCRKRACPPSLRFFGRRLYLGPVFVLACVLVHGITVKRAAQLQELVGVSIRTLARWRRWWLDSLPCTVFWKEARARFMPPVDEAEIPSSLLDRFVSPDDSLRLRAMLRFLAPLSGGT
jgi:hypothetical protein